MSEKKYDLFLISKYRPQLFGVSILWIMLYHAALVKYVWQPPFTFLKSGTTGVELFLLLSGISLYFSFSRDQRVLRFYRKRIIRLYVPVLTILTPGTFLFYHVYRHYSGAAFLHILDNKVSVLSFWHHYDTSIWFVSMILAAYLLYPLYYRFIFFKEDGIPVRTAFLCILAFVINWHLKYLLPDFYKYRAVAFCRFPAFITGCGAGYYVFHRRKVSFLVPIVSFVVFSAALIRLLPSPIGYDVSKVLLRLVTAASLIIVLSAVFDLVEHTPVRFINRFLGWLGSMTLEIYIVHIFLIQVYSKGVFSLYREGSLIRYLILILVSLPVSRLFSRLNWWLISYINRLFFKEVPSHAGK